MEGSATTTQPILEWMVTRIPTNRLCEIQVLRQEEQSTAGGLSVSKQFWLAERSVAESCS